MSATSFPVEPQPGSVCAICGVRGGLQPHQITYDARVPRHWATIALCATHHHEVDEIYDRVRDEGVSLAAVTIQYVINPRRTVAWSARHEQLQLSFADLLGHEGEHWRDTMDRNELAAFERVAQEWTGTGPNPFDTVDGAGRHWILRATSDPDLYDTYLRSQTWKARRLAVLKRAGRGCEECGKTGVPRDVHHITYTRIGDEPLDDLLALCRDCHQEAEADRKYAGAA